MLSKDEGNYYCQCDICKNVVELDADNYCDAVKELKEKCAALIELDDGVCAVCPECMSKLMDSWSEQ